MGSSGNPSVGGTRVVVQKASVHEVALEWVSRAPGVIRRYGEEGDKWRLISKGARCRPLSARVLAWERHGSLAAMRNGG